MELSRRNVLKGLSISGLTAATPSFSATARLITAAAGIAPISLHLIIDRAAQPRGFIEGAQVIQYRSGLHRRLPIMRCDTDLRFLRDFQKLLGCHRATRVVGLVDDANAAIIIGLARTAGVQLHWLGQHLAATERHTVLTAVGTPWEQLALRLLNGGTPTNWAMRLGYALTEFDSAPRNPAPSEPYLEHFNDGSFVSFVFDIQGTDHHG